MAKPVSRLINTNQVSVSSSAGSPTRIGSLGALDELETMAELDELSELDELATLVGLELTTGESELFADGGEPLSGIGVSAPQAMSSNKQRAERQTCPPLLLKYNNAFFMSFPWCKPVSRPR